jgi:hypothetical protein
MFYHTLHYMVCNSFVICFFMCLRTCTITCLLNILQRALSYVPPHVKVHRAITRCVRDHTATFVRFAISASCYFKSTLSRIFSLLLFSWLRMVLFSFSFVFLPFADREKVSSIIVFFFRFSPSYTVAFFSTIREHDCVFFRFFRVITVINVV